ncbi:hypothetical protein AB6A40_003098 [Gnathostoma spinigerum]|uniref:Prefoldin subunit 1 n=1 Tax=Gnathostoma spinigerum TaxID=75299 RepID=A0ABD6EE25_9BILA
MRQMNSGRNTMTSSYDEQLRKMFQDLQAKMIATKEKIEEGEEVCRNEEKAIKVASVVKGRLEELSDSNKVYRAVGRSFLLVDRKSELSRQDAVTKAAEEKIVAINKQKEYLQKSLVDAEQNLREMVMARP